MNSDEIKKLPEWGDQKSLDHELARARVERIFTAQAPHPSNLEKHETVINWSQQMAMVLFEVVPECEEKAIAMRKLQESCMWANEAISRHSVVPSPRESNTEKI